jgi:hypothetical protein
LYHNIIRQKVLLYKRQGEKENNAMAKTRKYEQRIHKERGRKRERVEG